MDINENNINEEHENKKTEDSSKHNSNNLKEEENEINKNVLYNKNNVKVLNGINKKYNSNCHKISKEKENKLINKKMINSAYNSNNNTKIKIQKHKNTTIEANNKNDNGNNNLYNIKDILPKKKKNTIFQNVSSGIKKVFKRSLSKNFKKNK